MSINPNEQSQGIYHKAFSDSPIIQSISTFKEGRYVEVNRAFFEILGYSREETIGRTSFELGVWVNENDRAELVARIKTSGRLHDYELKVRSKSGRVVVCRASAEVIESENQQYLLVLLEDISDKKRSEAELAASQKLLHQMSEVIQDVIYSVVLKPQPLIDYISPSVEQVLGFTQEEILKNPGWLFNNIYAEDRPDLVAYITFLDGTRALQPVMLRWLHKDGHPVWIEHRNSLVQDESGNISSFIGIGRDVTQRKNAEDRIMLNEARLESLLKLTQYNDPDVQHLLDYALQEAIQLTRSKLGYIYHYYEDREEFVLNTWSKEVLEACRIESAPTVYQLAKTGIWGEAVRQRKPIIVNDFRAPNAFKKGYPTGHAELLRFMTVPVMVNDKIVAVVGVANKAADYDQSDVRQLTLLMDSTWKLVERRRADEDRRLASQKLEELYQKEKHQREELQQEAKARGLFIDVLAHELRTPLTPILVSSGMLMDILKEQAAIERKLTINLYNSANNLAHRLEDLLDLARYSRGTFKLNYRNISLRSYLQDVIERFQPTIEQNRQFLTTEIAADLPEAQIDASRLEQVLLNLLSNASKYSGENCEIGFRAFLENDCFRVDVRDHGIGISMDDQEKLFQPYHRVEQDRQKYPGIGLGLAVARQIVEAHGGRIWITSQSGSGSTFSLSIPLKKSGNYSNGLL